eukprot:1160582-Pelagomonas_calceolata.AAC.10
MVNTRENLYMPLSPLDFKREELSMHLCHSSLLQSRLQTSPAVFAASLYCNVYCKQETLVMHLCHPPISRCNHVCLHRTCTKSLPLTRSRHLCTCLLSHATCTSAQPALQQDLHGFGYDPFAGAEEFRARKRQRTEQQQQALQEAAAAATSKLGMGGGQGARGAGAKRPRGVAFGGVSDVNDMEG